MKKIFALLVFMAVAGGVMWFRAKEQRGIFFPQGGERLEAGKAYMLRWNGGEKQIQLFLIDASLKNQGTSVSISDRVYGIENTGEYTYTIPVTSKPGEYELQIGTFLSKPFSIVAPE